MSPLHETALHFESNPISYSIQTETTQPSINPKLIFNGTFFSYKLDEKNFNQNALSENRIGLIPESSVLATSNVSYSKFRKVDLLAFPTDYQSPYSMTQENISNITKTYFSLENKTKVHLYDFDLKCQFAQQALLMAMLARQQVLSKSTLSQNEWLKRENIYLEKAKEKNKTAFKLAPFKSLPYYTEAKIKEYENINYLEITQVDAYMRLLLIAFNLDPENHEIRNKIHFAREFFENQWQDLYLQDIITQKTYQYYSLYLIDLLNEDPLKALFIKNPSLFQHASNLYHAKFFKQHSELQSIDNFEKAYPSAGAMILDPTQEQEVFNILSKNKDHPLMKQCVMIYKTACLNAKVANILKDAMLNYRTHKKTLRVFLGHPSDQQLLILSFEKDAALKQTQASLKFKCLALDNSSDSIYVIYLSSIKN